MPKREFNITQAARGAAITVRIVPMANRTELVEIEDDGTIKIRLMSPPVEGQANDELIAFLAEILDLSPADIEIVAGLESRKKLISMLNIRAAEVEEKVRNMLVG
nr:DUF167 domain-containing protein [Anaerolineae bacterium]